MGQEVVGGSRTFTGVKRARAGSMRIAVVAALIGALTVPAPTSPAKAASEEAHVPVAGISVGDVAAHRYPDGDPGALGYQVSYEVKEPLLSGDWLPTARIDAAEHPEAFEGQWADSGFHAAWISPKGKFQFQPSPFTIESAYLDNSLHHDATPLAPATGSTSQ